ncbi:MAG: SDR family NAD(P)-dependent oxidoreductase [Nitrospirota bacterium]
MLQQKNQSSINKRVLITGATSGIGYELCKLFAQHNYDLILVARNKKRLDHIANELSQGKDITVKTIPKDLSIPSSPYEIFTELESASTHIDILINNAGFTVYGQFSETDIQREMEMIRVNLVSLTILTKFFLPGMLSQGYGKILNVGSTGSFVAGPLNAVYCATKAYVLSFSEALAEELQGTNVTVTTLCPGATRTEFAKRAEIEDINLFRLQSGTMDARTVAETGYQALMKGKRSVVAGVTNKATIFSLRFMPRGLTAKLTKILMSRS